MPIPNMAAAFSGITQAVRFKLVAKTVVDGEVVQNPAPAVLFSGNLQPMPEQELAVKYEGEREWKYWKLWTTQRLPLDSEVVDQQNVRYRVMAFSNWQQARYFAYDLREGPAV